MTEQKTLPPTVYTTEQVANLLQVSPPTVRNLSAEGLLAPLPGLRTLRFTKAAVQKYLETAGGSK